MDKDKIIENMTKELIRARNTFIYVYRAIQLETPYHKASKEAESMIESIENCLYANLLENTEIIAILDMKH